MHQHRLDTSFSVRSFLLRIDRDVRRAARTAAGLEKQLDLLERPPRMIFDVETEEGTETGGRTGDRPLQFASLVEVHLRLCLEW